MSVSNPSGTTSNNSSYRGKNRSINDSGLLSGLLRPYWKWLVIIIAAMVLEMVMGLALPWPLKVIIDNVINGKPLPDQVRPVLILFTGGSSFSLATGCAIALVLITAIGGLAGYLNSYFTESVAQYMAKDLRQIIYHHLQHLSLAYYDTHRVGKLLSTLTTDVDTIEDFVSSTLLNILVDGLTILGMFGLMLYLKLDFALITIGIAPFLLLFVIRFRHSVKRATQEVRKDQAEMVAILQQGLESIRAVAAFSRQELEEERLEKVSRDTVQAALRARRIKSLISPVYTLAVSLCTAFVLWRGAGLVLSGILTVGSLTVFLTYLNKFFNPVKDLAKMTVNIAQATVALERIGQILHADLIIPQKPDAIEPRGLKGDIVFEHVYFSYIQGTPVLKDINLVIQAGQRTGICGPTGGGKSTIACLIPRLYDPTSGQIRMDGRPVSDYTLDGLRKAIGFVLQDTMLFFGSIRDNITYGRPGATDAEIVEAARLANADEFIRKFPLAYETIIGERGITLSGGERQRIGIARAVIRNAPILILDEPTGSLDPESEKIVTDALEKLMKGRTVILISHRLNTLVSADKIVVVREGMIVEEGTHQSLLAAGHLYAELYRMNSSKPRPASDA